MHATYENTVEKGRDRVWSRKAESPSPCATVCAWEDAMAQVKAFELWSSEIEDEEVAAVFAEYAEDEACTPRVCWKC
ncbi:MAG: hypothetical protein ACLUFV_02700 [Acutalibacteraceae bacterium]